MIRAELLNLSFLVCAIAKVLLMTGIGMGAAVALLAECCGFRVVALGIEEFGTGALRPEQSESGQVSGVKLELVSDFLSASSMEIAGRENPAISAHPDFQLRGTEST